GRVDGVAGARRFRPLGRRAAVVQGELDVRGAGPRVRVDQREAALLQLGPVRYPQPDPHRRVYRQVVEQGAGVERDAEVVVGDEPAAAHGQLVVAATPGLDDQAVESAGGLGHEGRLARNNGDILRQRPGSRECCWPPGQARDSAAPRRWWNSPVSRWLTVVRRCWPRRAATRCWS